MRKPSHPADIRKRESLIRAASLLVVSVSRRIVSGYSYRHPATMIDGFPFFRSVAPYRETRLERARQKRNAINRPNERCDLHRRRDWGFGFLPTGCVQSYSHPANGSQLTLSRRSPLLRALSTRFLISVACRDDDCPLGKPPSRTGYLYRSPRSRCVSEWLVIRHALIPSS